MLSLSDLRAATAARQTHTPPSTLALHIFTVASVYFIAGTLATLLAIAPSYVCPIWPSAGIALAAILIFGNRLWPGIFIGAVLINFYIAISVSSALSALVLALTIAAGATLQAVIGAYLVRRFAQFPNQLSSIKEVLSFYLFAALISPVISASIGVFTLFSTGHIQSSSLLLNWASWWLGDSIGILVFTPIILLWMLSVSRHGKKRRLSITLPILLVFLLTVIAFIYAAEKEKQQLTMAFSHETVRFNRALEKSIQKHVQPLQTLALLYSSSENMTRDQFSVFAKIASQPLNGVNALAWAPHIVASARPTFEAELSRTNAPALQISERNQQDQLHPAAIRREYVPISYNWSRQAQGFALGFDTYSVASNRLAIDRARDTASLAISSIKPVTTAGQPMLLAFMPVYGQGLARYNLAYRRSHVIGYMTASLNLTEIVATALNKIKSEGLSYRLTDVTDIQAQQLLLSNALSGFADDTNHASGLAGRGANLSNTTFITIGGRLWQFELWPTPAYIGLHRSHGEWLVLLVGLMLTGLTGIFVMVLSGRSSQLAKLDEQHTALIATLEANRNSLEQTVSSRTQELKSAMYKLRLSEERYQLAMDAVNDGLFDWDVNSNQVYVNDNYLSMLGYGADELGDDANSCWQDLLHPLEHEAIMASTQQSLKHEPMGEFEFRMRCRDGSYKWIMSRRKVVERDDQAMATRVVGTHTDITLRKHIELELLHNEADLQTIFAQSPDGIVVFDHAHLLSDVNQLFCQMIGFDKQQLLGISELELNALIQRLCNDAIVGAAGRSHRQQQINIFATKTYDHSLSDKREGHNSIELLSPSYRILQHRLTTLNQQRISNIVHFRDITGEAMVDRMKSEFLMTAAHELRTPMTIIRGYVELLKQRSYDQATQATMLDSIHEQSLSIVGLLDELLDLARIESRAGKAFNLEMAPLASTIESLAKSFIVFGDTRQVILKPIPALPELLIDQEKIRQAIKNCLSNAFKYSTAPAEVSLEVAIVNRHDYAEVAIMISDHGIGMTAQQLSHIFEKFYRADTSGRVAGTGLGMTLVKEIIEHHGGRVQVVSQMRSAGRNESHGTVVTLWLPIASTKPLAA